MALTFSTLGSALHANSLTLKDGVAAVAAATGKAAIFVDTADGDLKVEFSDDFGAVVQADS